MLFRTSAAKTKLALLIAFSISLRCQPGNTMHKQPTHSEILRTPLAFEPNLGQAAPGVLFIARGAGYTTLLRSTTTEIVLPSNERIQMRLSGAQGRPKPEQPLPSVSNYYLGSDPTRWHTGIPNYGRVKVPNVYPGIDAVYYGNRQRLEYDLRVQPGVDPKQIRLTYSGVDSIRLDAAGDLLLSVNGRELRQRRPLVYQEIAGRRVAVEAAYEISPQSPDVRFALAHYDSGRPLVIDPTLELASLTYFGGGNDAGAGIALDSSGTAYITGYTAGNLFALDPEQSTFGGDVDAFVAKIDSSGNLQYSTYVGGSGKDFGTAITVDNTGAAYIAGYTGSTNFPTLSPKQSSNGGGLYDAFLVKLSSSGALAYSTYLGGPNEDRAFGVAVDSTGAAFVTGITYGSFPLQNAAQATFGGGFDAFVAKFDVTGSNLVYSTYLGGSDNDQGNGIAVDSNGAAYIAGFSKSTNFPMLNAYQGTFGGGFNDAFITKLSSSGAIVYSTYLGGSGTDGANAIAVDGDGSAYVAGFASTGFPTQNATQSTIGSPGDFDAFVAKLSPAGSLVYSTFLGGSTQDVATGIALDSSGAAYVAGITFGGFPLLNPSQSTYGGNEDAFVAKLNSSGQLVYATYLGGPSLDTATAIAVDQTGVANVTGLTNGSIPGAVSQHQYSTGAQNAFVARIFDPTAVLSTAKIADISPNGAVAGQNGFTLYVEGSGFKPNAVVWWNQTALATVNTSATNLSATVPQSLIAATGVASITVLNPGESPSNAAILTVSSTATTPSLSDAWTNYTWLPNGAFNTKVLNVTGSSFQPGAVIRWNGTVLPNVVSSYGGASGTIDPTLLQPGLVTITATNPGGTASSPLTFTVPALRTISSISPATVCPGCGSFTLTVNGSGFAPADRIVMNPGGFNAIANYISSSQLQVVVPGSYIATAGTLQVWVETPAAGAQSNVALYSSTNQKPLVVIAPVLSITATDSGHFTLGQNGATYLVTVKNTSASAATSGTVTVTETLPTGLTLVSMAGTGWTCPGTAANNCTRSDALAAGASYPVITVTVNVASNAPTPVTNQVSVSGGGSATANGTDSTAVAGITIVRNAVGCYSAFVQGEPTHGTSWNVTPNVGTLYVVTQFIGITPASISSASADQLNVACYTPTASNPPNTVALQAVSLADGTVTASINLDGRTGLPQ